MKNKGKINWCINIMYSTIQPPKITNIQDHSFDAFITNKVAALGIVNLINSTREHPHLKFFSKSGCNICVKLNTSTCAEAYAEPYQTSKMECFAKVAKG